MNTHLIKKIVVDFMPPIITRFIRHRRQNRGLHYGWFGDYRNWKEALKHCSGYNSEAIVEKVKIAVQKVLKGEAKYERDSVAFSTIEYSWPLLAGLMWIASQNKNCLNVVDFGGSLGTIYYQNRIFFENLDKLSWNIVEQPIFVDCGKRCFEDGKLVFYYDIASSQKKAKSDCLILSSVLPYLSAPYEFIEEAVRVYNFEFMIVDKTYFALNGKDRLTIQKVPPYIYEASYPCWFLNEKQFLNKFLKNYQLVESYESVGYANIPSAFKGFIFKRRTQ